MPVASPPNIRRNAARFFMGLATAGLALMALATNLSSTSLGQEPGARGMSASVHSLATVATDGVRTDADVVRR
ncbi:MAG: hypothetical protein ACI91F_002786 [Candidatus Binatia bacterium]|jgi:hypothetical protein